MVYIPVPDTAQVEMVALMAGQRTQWVLHYKKDPVGNYDVPALSDLAAALVAAINGASVKGLFPTTWSLIEVRAIDMEDQFGPAVSASSGLPIVGTRAGGQLPNNVALVLTKRTSARGRSFRGRLYFGPLVEADVTDNTVSGAIVTSIIGNLGAVLLTVVGASFTHRLQVVSRFTNNAARVTGIATQVTGWTSDGIVDSQRRRLPGRGN